MCEHMRLRHGTCFYISSETRCAFRVRTPTKRVFDWHVCSVTHEYSGAGELSYHWRLFIFLWRVYRLFFFILVFLLCIWFLVNVSADQQAFRLESANSPPWHVYNGSFVEVTDCDVVQDNAPSVWGALATIGRSFYAIAIHAQLNPAPWRVYVWHGTHGLMHYLAKFWHLGYDTVDMASCSVGWGHVQFLCFRLVELPVICRSISHIQMYAHGRGSRLMELRR